MEYEPLKQKALDEKHEKFVREFSVIQTNNHDQRQQCLQDRRFYSISGAQWEGDLEDEFVNRPKFEVNKVHLSVIRIFNEYRNNRITVDFISKDGSKADDLADLCDGLYRANEQDSNAQEAYDNAFEEAASGGIGAWRYSTRYVNEYDEDDDRQEIIIEPIFDADSCVFFDLSCKRQDKSDARRCYVIEPMYPADFEDQYGYMPEGPLPSSVDKLIDTAVFDWVTDDVVYVAEVYEVENKTQTLHVWELLTGDTIKLTDDENKDQKSFLKLTGAKKKKEKKIKRNRVHKYIMAGDRMLEDCGYIAGDKIPIVMSFGKRWVVDNVERCMGHVRLAKDAQRLKNMQISNLATISSIGHTEKPIFYPEQILAHKDTWASDNVEQYPYALIDPIKDVDGNIVPSGPLGYTKPPSIPPALAALLQLTEQDIQDVLGNQQDGERVVGNVSTETAMLVQNRLDMQTYIYMSNFSKAMQQGGRIWLGMARDVYVEDGREVKTINAQSETAIERLNVPMLDESGNQYNANDLSRAMMDVISSVGPASTTAKSATVKNLTNMLSAATDPETQQVLVSAIMMNMEGEGVSDIRKYFRKRLIRMGAVEPTDEEAKMLAEEQANQKPGPEEEYFRAEAERARAAAVESQADVILKQAKAEETQAKTAKTLSDIDAQQQEQAFEAMEKLGPSVNPPKVEGSPIFNS